MSVVIGYRKTGFYFPQVLQMVEVSDEILSNLVGDNSFFFLQRPIESKPGYILWCNFTGEVCYEKKDAVIAKLRKPKIHFDIAKCELEKLVPSDRLELRLVVPADMDIGDARSELKRIAKQLRVTTIAEFNGKELVEEP